MTHLFTKIPSKMEVAPLYKLLTLLILRTKLTLRPLFTLLTLPTQWHIWPYILLHRALWKMKYDLIPTSLLLQLEAGRNFETFIASTSGLKPFSSTDTNSRKTAIMTKLKWLSLSLSLESENESKNPPKPPPSRLHRPRAPPADLLSPRSGDHRAGVPPLTLN